MGLSWVSHSTLIYTSELILCSTNKTTIFRSKKFQFWETEPHEVKKKSFDLGGNRTHDLRIRSSVTLPTELRGRTERVGDDLGGESRRRELALIKFTLQS